MKRACQNLTPKGMTNCEFHVSSIKNKKFKYMKNIFKLLAVIITTSIIYISCDLNEDPPFLSSENVFATVEGADVALNGVFEAFAGFNYYSADFHHATDFTSGLFVSGKRTDRSNIAALSPLSSQNYPTNLWRQMYVAISRCNDIIANIPTDSQDAELNNILGMAYFLRAHTYFNLVRLYGGVPLHTEPASSATLHKPRASVEEVYNLIIADAEKAKTLMLDAAAQKNGRPGKLAANMLLAKVYMQLAGNDNASANWQKAYDEAIQVFGQYSLVPNYGDLWSSIATANNNSESIFEIQFNEENNSRLTRLFTPNNAFAGRGWQRIRPNPETIDMHTDKYPDDPRIAFTFISTYDKFPSGVIKVYPDANRSNFNKGFPYLYKYFIKDQSATTDANNFNYIQYRYADLLLMLAEIENELNGPDNAYQYVNEVLARARNSGDSAVEPADWSGLAQDEFRAAIMREYQYELLGEGHDWFVGRRRGYNFFKTNYIDVHNTRIAIDNKNYDIEYPDDQKAMLLPIPSVEINSNQQISASDQNPGY
ncbi:MAG TPA: RagB/SusD family nutrient uptake outer membrane protein [Flavobacteriia bacterium]|nr:RagB/SusD family nutrient uptake outer membrane protein [Flavobacteriia bacterium]